MAEIEQVTCRAHDGNNYVRTGNTIRCYRVLSRDMYGQMVESESTPLFEITLSSEHCDSLMNDLYYGEYDGA